MRKNRNTRKVLGVLLILIVLMGVMGNCIEVEATSTGFVTKDNNTQITRMAIILIICLAIYIVPTIIAYKRKHPNKEDIMLINILLGWTLLGWCGSLIWALKYRNETENTTNECEDLERVKRLKEDRTITEADKTENTNSKMLTNVSDNKYENLAILRKLKDDGAITEIEFEIEKAKILK